jgi:hypothetical protein
MSSRHTLAQLTLHAGGVVFVIAAQAEIAPVPQAIQQAATTYITRAPSGQARADVDIFRFWAASPR